VIIGQLIYPQTKCYLCNPSSIYMFFNYPVCYTRVVYFAVTRRFTSLARQGACLMVAPEGRTVCVWKAAGDVLRTTCYVKGRDVCVVRIRKKGQADVVSCVRIVYVRIVHTYAHARVRTRAHTHKHTRSHS